MHLTVFSLPVFLVLNASGPGIKAGVSHPAGDGCDKGWQGKSLLQDEALEFWENPVCQEVLSREEWHCSECHMAPLCSILVSQESGLGWNGSMFLHTCHPSSVADFWPKNPAGLISYNRTVAVARVGGSPSHLSVRMGTPRPRNDRWLIEKWRDEEMSGSSSSLPSLLDDLEWIMWPLGASECKMLICKMEMITPVPVGYLEGLTLFFSESGIQEALVTDVQGCPWVSSGPDWDRSWFQSESSDLIISHGCGDTLVLGSLVRPLLQLWLLGLDLRQWAVSVC